MGYLKRHKVMNPRSKVLFRDAAHWEAAYTRLSRWRRNKLARLSEAQNHRCCYCACETYLTVDTPAGMKKTQRATLEHYNPHHLDQQTNKDENLIMACTLCNGLRATKDPIEFYDDLIAGNLENIMPRKAATKVRRRDRKEKRIKEKLEDEPEKMQAKQQRTLMMACIIVACWPDHVNDIIAMTERRETKQHSKACYTVNKIKTHVEQVPRNRIAA